MWTGKVLEARGSELPEQFRDKFREEERKNPEEKPKEVEKDECADCPEKENCDIPKVEMTKMQEVSEQISELLRKSGIKSAEVIIKPHTK